MSEHETSVLAAQPFAGGLPPAQLRELARLCEHLPHRARAALTRAVHRAAEAAPGIRSG